MAVTNNILPDETLPRNVLWFEVLNYLSLAINSLTAAFRDDSALEAAALPPALNLLTAALIAAFIYLVWLAARRRKNWARWVLLVALVLSALSLSQMIGDDGLQPSSLAELMSSLLAAAGLYFSFTGDARGWFGR